MATQTLVVGAAMEFDAEPPSVLAQRTYAGKLRADSLTVDGVAIEPEGDERPTLRLTQRQWLGNPKKRVVGMFAQIAALGKDGAAAFITSGGTVLLPVSKQGRPSNVGESGDGLLTLLGFGAVADAEGGETAESVPVADPEPSEGKRGK